MVEENSPAGWLLCARKTNETAQSADGDKDVHNSFSLLTTASQARQRSTKRGRKTGTDNLHDHQIDVRQFTHQDFVHRETDPMHPPWFRAP